MQLYLNTHIQTGGCVYCIGVWLCLTYSGTVTSWISLYSQRVRENDVRRKEWLCGRILIQHLLIVTKLRQRWFSTSVLPRWLMKVAHRFVSEKALLLVLRQKKNRNSLVALFHYPVVMGLVMGQSSGNRFWDDYLVKSRVKSTDVTPCHQLELWVKCPLL